MAGQSVGIQVCVRVRHVDAQNQEDLPVQCDKDFVLIQNAAPMQFDRVLSSQATQKELFATVKDAAEVCLKGYKSTIFAYGQTGSGKTYSMLGENGGLSLSEEKMGVIPRCTRFLFWQIANEIQASDGRIQYQVRASFVEVYNGRAFDLISKTARKPLSVRESSEGEVDCIDAEEIPVQSTEAVMRVLNLGATNRATGATDMNLHSSRSHAVFMLKVERREKSEQGAKSFVKMIGRVNLVDLAGSEDVNRSNAQGQRFKEAVEINTGLLQLHRVLEAIRDKQPFVPYRDSVLTRLLKDSIGGSARTVLLANVSPLREDLGQTLSTLRYAAMARCVRNKQVQAAQKGEEEAHPMDDDFDDPEGLQRRTVFLQTASYGRVFARVAGDSQGELVLLVHGSGPTNSSIWWNKLVNQLLTLDTSAASRGQVENRARSLFMVAIDCPGYGRSAGDKQSIRSNPGSFLSEVVAAVGRAQAYCLVGSSQGAASSFNALLECPRIAKFLAVMDPVCHDPSRFTSISQPVLMVYDRDDAGHPVSVGRVAARNLPQPSFFEFASSTEPDWIRRNFAAELLKLWANQDPRGPVGVRAGPRVLDRSVRAAGEERRDAASMELAGGVMSWLNPSGRESHACWVDEREQDKETARVRRMCEERGLAAGGENMFESEEQSRPSMATEDRIVVLQPLLSAVECADDAPLSENAVHVGAEPADQPKQCCVCLTASKERLGEEPGALAVLPACRHGVCLVCAAFTLAIDPWACPAAGCCMRIPSAASLPASIKPVPAPRGQPTVLLEYGNTAKVVGGPQGKVDVTAFLRVVSAVGAGAGGKLIRSVGFDINPTYPGTAPTASSPPFELTRCMAGRFPCDMLISWVPQLSWQPLRIRYTVVHGEAKHCRRVRVDVVPLINSGRKLSDATFELGGTNGLDIKVPVCEIGRKV